MSKVVKITIGVVSLILLAGIGSIYALKFKKQSEPQQPQQFQQSQTAEQELVTQDKQVESKIIQTVELDGIISKVTKEDIEVQKGEIKNTLLFNQNISVILVSSVGVEKKDISYLKSGQKISITLNQSDSNIISIQILEGDNASKIF